MLTQFKEKFSNVKTGNEKYMILTCLPKRSEQKIMVEFGLSLHVARTAKLTPREVVLRNPPSRRGGKRNAECGQRTLGRGGSSS